MSGNFSSQFKDPYNSPLFQWYELIDRHIPNDRNFTCHLISEPVTLLFLKHIIFLSIGLMLYLDHPTCHVVFFSYERLDIRADSWQFLPYQCYTKKSPNALVASRAFQEYPICLYSTKHLSTGIFINKILFWTKSFQWTESSGQNMSDIFSRMKYFDKICLSVPPRTAHRIYWSCPYRPNSNTN